MKVTRHIEESSAPAKLSQGAEKGRFDMRIRFPKIGLGSVGKSGKVRVASRVKAGGDMRAKLPDTGERFERVLLGGLPTGSEVVVLGEHYQVVGMGKSGRVVLSRLGASPLFEAPADLRVELLRRGAVEKMSGAKTSGEVNSQGQLTASVGKHPGGRRKGYRHSAETKAKIAATMRSRIVN